MTWQTVAAFLACARVGAVHFVVFACFSAESLRDRVRDCASRVLITTDEGCRGGNTIATNAALKECPTVEHVLVLKRTGKTVPWTEGCDNGGTRPQKTLSSSSNVSRYEYPSFWMYIEPLILIGAIVVTSRRSGSTGNQRESSILLAGICSRP